MIIQELPYYSLPSIPSQKAESVEAAQLIFKQLFVRGEQAYFHSHRMTHGHYESWVKELAKWLKFQN